MKRVLIVFSALGLVLAACGGGANKAASSGGDETAEKAGDNATDPGEQDDEAAGEGSSGGLKAKLLDASDLPRGFKRTLAEERDPQADKDDAQDSSDFCPELDKLDEEYPGDREAEANFERTTEQGGAYLNQQIARFKNVDQADEAFSAFEKGFANCKTFTEKDADSEMTGSFEKAEFAKIGDDTYATVFKATQSTTADGGASVSLGGYFIALREGKHIILIVALGFGDEVTKSELESVAKKGAGKL